MTPATLGLTRTLVETRNRCNENQTDFETYKVFLKISAGCIKQFHDFIFWLTWSSFLRVFSHNNERTVIKIFFFQTFSFLLVNHINLNHITYDIVIILTVTIITQDFKFVFLGYRYGGWHLLKKTVFKPQILFPRRQKWKQQNTWRRGTVSVTRWKKDQTSYLQSSM